jgi:hypothetical protein
MYTRRLNKWGIRKKSMARTSVTAVGPLRERLHPQVDVHPFSGEKVLSATRWCFESCTALDTSPSLQTTPTMNLQTFWHDMDTAFYLFRVDSLYLGFETLHGALDHAKNAMMAEPIEAITQLVIMLPPSGLLTQKFPDLVERVVSHLVEICKIGFGPLHPLVRIIRGLHTGPDAPETFRLVLSLIRDSYHKTRGPFDPATFSSHVALIKYFRRTRNLAAAEESARALVTQHQLVPGLSDKQGMRAARLLSHVLKAQQRHDESLQLCQDIFHRLDGDAPTDKLHIYIQEDIADLHRLRGESTLEAAYLERALELAKQQFGPVASPTRHIQRKLEECQSRVASPNSEPEAAR